MNAPKRNQQVKALKPIPTGGMAFHFDAFRLVFNSLKRQEIPHASGALRRSVTFELSQRLSFVNEASPLHRVLRKLDLNKIRKEHPIA